MFVQVVCWILEVFASLRSLQITSTAVAAVVQVAAECFHGQKPRTPVAAVGQPARTAERRHRCPRWFLFQERNGQNHNQDEIARSRLASSWGRP